MPDRLTRDFEQFGSGLPREPATHVRETYGIDLTARYLGIPIPHPIGKGSGQLSLNADQLEADRAAGLAFVILKTVIAEDPAGERTMGAWAVHETKMRVERRRAGDGREGWTVTWKGRGWDRSFDDYLALVRLAGDLTRAGELLAVPSVKYHLPRLDEPFHRPNVALLFFLAAHNFRLRASERRLEFRHRVVPFEAERRRNVVGRGSGK